MTVPRQVVPPAAVLRWCGRLGRLVRLVLAAVSMLAAAAIITAAVLALVVAVGTRVPAGGGVATAFGHPVLQALSGAMAPAIAAGDLIVEDPVTTRQARRLAVGQIATFTVPGEPGQVTTRRIIGRVTVHGLVEYVTRADEAPAADPGLRPSDQVIGVYLAAVPCGSYILAAMHRPVAIAGLLGSILLALAAVPLHRRSR